jgi:beta-N-acetylhexosaminidase
MRRRLALAAIAVAALAAGLIAGAGGDDGGSEPPPPRAGGAPSERVSFLARIVPPEEERERASGPAVPRSVEDLARRLPLERKVAQLFLLGFRGTDLNAEIFRRLQRLDVGALLVAAPNYTTPDVLSQLGGEAVVVSQQAKHVPPLVMAVQDGGDLNSFPDLPPALAGADLESAGAAGAQALDTGRALRGLNVTGLLGPSVDVGLEHGSPLGARIYSDDAEEVAAYADAVVRAYRRARVFAAVKHFPGLGAADQSTEEGPATVGLDVPELEQRDLLPFRAAIESGVPGVLLGHALYPFDDFTLPASLSRTVATELLREELRFQGVAITDDLADPAVTTLYSVPDAAVRALRAGADMLFVSGPPGDQQSAYVAVLRAARSGRIPRARLDEALLRVLAAKKDYGLIR